MDFPIDHDLHCHSRLSSCSSDPAQTPDAILAHARAHGYSCVCVTDHFWDSPAVPGASGWYRPQDLAHVRSALPLPDGGGVRFAFGCETEWCGGAALGIAPEHHDAFDFIVVPPNHFHMKGFVRPADVDTEEKAALLLVERLEGLLAHPLPWPKVGIAHLNCGLAFSEGDLFAVLRAVPEDRFRAAMRAFAERGAGIELNCGCFAANRRRAGYREDDELRLFRLAKDEGCRFYLASDAHHPDQLGVVPDVGPSVVSALGLDARHLYRIP